MKQFQKVISLFLCVVLFCGAFATGASAIPADKAWEDYYADYIENGSAILFSPGANETERNLSWYSLPDAGTPRVLVSEAEDMTDAKTFTGTFIKTPEGDRSNKVTITGLEPGKTYFYKCVTDLGESSAATFSTVSGNDFTAMYTTDIHVSKTDESKDDQDALVFQSYTYSQLLEKANANTPLDLIISAGDQATRGYRSEYTALVAAPLMRSVPFAPCVGNHDRKGIAYKYFTNNPNEYKKALVTPFISYDYYYVKGDAIFFVFDSNCLSMTDHRNFVKAALRENPNVKWRIATFHHDLYGQRIPHRESENTYLRLMWAPMMDEFRFDLVLLGHSHYYTMSNAMFGNTTKQKLAGLDEVTDPQGAIVMVSGSVNHPRTMEEGNEPPVGGNVAYAYLTENPIYNLIDFSEDSLVIRSYELNDSDPFHTFTIRKTTDVGGHPSNIPVVRNFFIRLIADICGFFNEFGATFQLKMDWKDFVGQ